MGTLTGMFQFLVTTWLVAAVCNGQTTQGQPLQDQPTHAPSTEILLRECINLTLHESRRPEPPDADVPVPLQAVFNKSVEEWLTKDNSSFTLDKFQNILAFSTENLILLDVFSKMAERVTEASLHWGRVIMNVTTNHDNDTEMHQLDPTTVAPKPKGRGDSGPGGNYPPPPSLPPPGEISVPRRVNHLRKLASYGVVFFYEEPRPMDGAPPPFEKFLDGLLQEQISEALKGALAFGYDMGKESNGEDYPTADTIPIGTFFEGLNSSSFGHDAENYTGHQFPVYPTADTSKFDELKANLTHDLDFVGRLMTVTEKVQALMASFRKNASPAFFTYTCSQIMDRITCKTCPGVSQEANASLEMLKSDLQMPLSILDQELQSVSRDIGERYRIFMAEKRRQGKCIFIYIPMVRDPVLVNPFSVKEHQAENETGVNSRPIPPLTPNR